jgi:hypothetical protein
MAENKTRRRSALRGAPRVLNEKKDKEARERLPDDMFVIECDDVGEFLRKFGKTKEDVLRELQQCEDRDECLGKGVA